MEPAISASEKDVNRYIIDLTETRALSTATCSSSHGYTAAVKQWKIGTTVGQHWELEGVSVAVYSAAVDCNCHKLSHPTP